MRNPGWGEEIALNIPLHSIPHDCPPLELELEIFRQTGLRRIL